MSRILLIDNYDSFTYNLVQQVRESSTHELTVIRNDELTISDASTFDAIMLSPGPGLPAESGILMPLIEHYSHNKPIYGVCLGMQALAEAHGGRLFNVKRPLHGVSTEIDILEPEMFPGSENTIQVGRYHSWAVDPSRLPEEFILTAVDKEGTPMAMRHESLPLFGVQFHPESILTEHGTEMISFFLNRLTDK